MRQIRSVFIWFVALVWLIPVLIFLIIASYLVPAKRYDPIIKTLARGLFFIMGIRLTVEGLENVDFNQIHLYMANHISLLDVPLFQAVIPQLVRGIEAEEQFNWPIFGWAIRRAGNIPINRQNVHAAIPSAKEAARCLQEGLSMIILPEGGRTLTGKMKPFKKLPFHLAKEGGVPIVPIGVSGLYRVLKKGEWIITPGPVRVRFGNPISLKTIQALSVPELRNYVRGKIEELIDSP
ncbi:MAG: 1-acyl-sn-glycerol-3-phosphate acyltransferase [Acidobacteria bacterium]|nr:1-acyl-sn-glycerol-3-phosphate acyltransferase [Acidobacteriota bacterium]